MLRDELVETIKVCRAACVDSGSLGSPSVPHSLGMFPSESSVSNLSLSMSLYRCDCQ